MSFASYVIIIIVAFLRGGDGMKSIIGIEYCSSGGWMLFVTAQVCCICAALGSLYRNRVYLLDPSQCALNQEKDDIGDD